MELVSDFPHFLQFLLAESGFQGRHLLFGGFRLLFFLARFRSQGQQALVGIVQQHCLDKLFVIALVDGVPQKVQALGELQAGGGIAAIQPGLHYVQTIDQAFGIDVEIGFPHLEFFRIQFRFQKTAGNLVPGQILKGAVDHLYEFVFLFGVSSAHFHGEHGLQLGTVQAAGYVGSDSGPQQGQPQGSVVPVQQHMGQKLQGHDPFLIQGTPHHDIHGKIRLVFRIRTHGHRVRGLYFLRLVEGSLQGDINLQGTGLREGTQVFPVEIVQVVVDVHIAIQVDVTVFRAVVFLVESHEPFLGQTGDGTGQATGFKSVGAVREQGLADFVFFDGIRGGIHPLHFIVHHSVVHQGLVLAGSQFIVPALLAQGKGIFGNQGVEYRIQVHIHQIAEVLVVAAGHRIYGLVRVGHGIQERVQGPFHQFHERFLQFVFAAAAQDGMFRDVGHAGIILAGGTEADGKDFVVVLRGQVEQMGPALVVGHFIGSSADIGQLIHPIDGESMVLAMDSQFHVVSDLL